MKFSTGSREGMTLRYRSNRSIWADGFSWVSERLHTSSSGRGCAYVFIHEISRFATAEIYFFKPLIAVPKLECSCMTYMALDRFSLTPALLRRMVVQRKDRSCTSSKNVGL